jgi:TldD protein
MTTIIDEAKHLLLEPSGLTETALDKILGVLHGTQIDQADLYFQSHQAESWSLEDGRVKDAVYTLDKGVGIRAISGEKTGFAYSDEIILPALEQAAQAARSITRSGQSGTIQTHHKTLLPKALYPAVNPLDSLTKQEKISLLQQINTLARASDPRVKEVLASLSGEYEVILVVNEDGTYAADIRPLVHLNITVIAQHNGRREHGRSGGGGRYDYSRIVDPALWQEHTHQAVRLALLNLDAVDAPAGNMPVVLGAGWPGVLLHEAVGHGLEGDFNRHGSSAFSNKMGERVASPLVTIVDDGTLFERRGSLTVDDEGNPTQCTTLIEHGILKNYMQDKLNARLMGMQATGNGRRESYAHLPMPRMTNTYMLAGESDPGEIIASVQNGIYAVNFAGGQVDITSGKFVFSTSEAYLIENGKITHPVKGATLIGNGPEAMQKVSMVGNDLALDQGIGVCGKNGQSVPVGVGQPTLKVDELTVGGTRA